MERETSDRRDWNSFYARTSHLPRPELTREFLNDLPQAARVLDFGAGSGAWASAFLRDRPDLTVDVLDKNIDKAASLPPDFAGQRIASTFEEFRAPETPYDAIWARSVLFFLERPALESCFHQLAQSVKSGGTLAFTMVEDCEAAALSRFHGMSDSSLREMLDKEGVELIKMAREEFPYGAKAIVIPTFDVFVRKR